MALTIFAGIAVAALLTAMAVVYQRAPTRVRCPECGGATQPVMAPQWLRKAAPRLQGRWCPQCSWEGLGRVGPEWVSGRLIAHDSGFHWGDERLPMDFGFRWRPLPEARPTGRPTRQVPDHPSGFRFADLPEDADSGTTMPAHRSGFAWRRTDAPAAQAPRAVPPAFEWGGPKAPPGFTWKDTDGKRPPPPFTWKGGA